MTNQIILYLVVIVYLGLMIGLGIVFRNFNKNVSDYFKSGSRASWWLVGTSIFMAATSAKTFTANGGVAYEAGWTIYIEYLSVGVAAFLQAIFLAHLFRQTRAITYAELLRDRFGPRTQFFYASMGVILWLLSGGIWLWGLAIFVGSVFGLNTQMLIIVLGLAVLFYSTVGGAWAVMANDFIQGIIMIVMTTLLAILCLHKLGGFSGLFEHLNATGLTEQYHFIKSSKNSNYADPYQYTAPWIAAVGTFTLFTNLSLGNAVKFFSVKTGRDARFAAVAMGFLSLLGMLIFFIPPITAKIFWFIRLMRRWICGDGGYGV